VFKTSIYLFLNILSIRLVTKYPPTTLTVAKKTAVIPRIKEISDSIFSALEERMAPTIVIPEIAFAPDIRGVCKIDGTLEINSIPKKIESTNTNNNKINTASISLVSFFNE